MRTCTLLSAAFAIAASASALAADYTPPGTRLAIGQPAQLPMHIPYKPDAQVKITVTSIDEGALTDFTQYKVPPEAADTKPYYVHYHVILSGNAEVPGGSSMMGPIAVDDRNEKHMPSLTESKSGNARFDRCRVGTFHSGATDGASYDSCEIFLIHKTGALKFFGFQLYETPYWKSPVTWQAGPPANSQSDAQGTLEPGH